MTKRIKIFSLFIVFLAICILLVSCSNGEDSNVYINDSKQGTSSTTKPNDSNSQNNNDKEIQKDEEEIAKVISISIDSSSIPKNLYAGQVVLTSIKMNVEYSDGTYDSIALSNDFLTVQSKSRLLKSGRQTIDVLYERCSCSFVLDLLDPDDVDYTLTIRGGIPIRVDGKQVSVSSVNGEYSNSYPKGTKVTIKWEKEDGMQFDYWEIVEGQLRSIEEETLITMTQSYTFQAHYSKLLHTVTFVTFNSDTIAPIRQERLDSEADITSSMTMDRYVFVGWTTKELSQSEALSGTVTDNLVQFPYTIEKNTTFYAVWAPIGFSYTNHSVTTAGGKKIDGKQIVSYEGSLTELDIPSTIDGFNVISISKDAFSSDKAKNLTKINIPASIYQIDEGAFRNCSSLQAFYVDAGSITYSAERGVLYMNDKTVLVAYPLGKVESEYKLEPSVNKICDYAFYNAIVGGIVMTVDVASIGEHAFDSVHIDHVDFTSLLYSKLESSMTTRKEKSESEYNRYIQSIFSDYLCNICVSPSQEEMYSELFAPIRDKIVVSQSGLHSVFVEEIGTDVSILFRLINGEYFDIKTKSAEILGVTRTINSIQIPDALLGRSNEFTVTSIAEHAFNDCIFLQNVILPTELERVCDDAFLSTPWAEELPNLSIIANNTLYKYLGTDAVYKLDESIKRIAEGAFINNKTLTTVNITDNFVLERIDAYAFSGCVNLKCFAGTTETSLLIKSTLKKIDAYAFYGSALMGIETQNSAKGSNGSLREIGEKAFAENVYLETVDIDIDSLQKIDSRAFISCYALQSLHVSSENAYYASFNGILYKKEEGDDYSLFLYPTGKICEVFNPSKPGENIEISVKLLGSYSLWYSNIGALEFEENLAVTNSDAIYIPSLMYVKFLNKVSLNNSIYSAQFVGKTGAEKFVFDSDLPDLQISRFFDRNEMLVSQYSTREVPYTFYYEESILYAENNGDVIVVGSDRSSESDMLVIPANIEIGGNLVSTKKIGRYAFYGYNLKELTLNGVSELYDYALSGAFSLTKLTINELNPENVPIIYEHSMGDNFEKDLLIYINCDPNAENSYFSKWEGIITTVSYKDTDNQVHVMSPKVIYNNAFAVFTYIDQSTSIEYTVAIEYGTIQNNINALMEGKNTGYSVGGWIDVQTEQEIDVTNGYVIPYNTILQCQWIADTYTLYFIVPEGISLAFDATFVEDTAEGKKYVVTQTFGQGYDFSVNRSQLEINTYDFNGWNLNGVRIDAVANADEGKVWTTYLEGEGILRPDRSLHNYTLMYLVESDVDLHGKTGEVMHYGQHYTLVVPSKNGYQFIGWRLEDSHVQLTDEFGADYGEWRITDLMTEVVPIWEALTIRVQLILDDGVEYGSVEVLFESMDYTIPFSAENILDIYYDEYSDKLEFFAGWADASGKIYTDEQGNAMIMWDKYTESVLHAVWPILVYTASDLRTEIMKDSNVSIVLMEDIEITEVIPVSYNGVFNGNGKKITLTLTESIYSNSSDYNGLFSIGLFSDNYGTVKNLILDISYDIDVSDDVNLIETYIGGICGFNGGIIENISVTVKKMHITVGTNSGLFYIGGICGENLAGIVRNVTETIEGEKEGVASFTLNLSKATVYAGTVIGYNYGSVSITALSIQSYSVRYEDKVFGGEIFSVGSVIGITSEEVSGSCRYYDKPFDSYIEYIEDTASAIKEFEDEKWETAYQKYYYYKYGFIVQAEVTFMDDTTYYKQSETTVDFFKSYDHRYGNGLFVEDSLSFSVTSLN